MKSKINDLLRRFKSKPVAAALSLALVAAAIVGVTAAFIKTNTEPVKNEFTPASVDCSVEEEFDGTTKKNVTVRNDGDTPTFVRVRLVSYRVDGEGDQQTRIGGTTEIPTFTPGEGWVSRGDYYYYTLPVAPGQTPAHPLIPASGIALSTYTDADGGRQVIEVLAEAIQSEPDDAAESAWEVVITNGVLSVN